MTQSNTVSTRMILSRTADRLQYWTVTVVVVGLILCVGFVVYGALRCYCVFIKREHSWERWPETDFSPAQAECRVCGKSE